MQLIICILFLNKDLKYKNPYRIYSRDFILTHSEGYINLSFKGKMPTKFFFSIVFGILYSKPIII